MCLKCLFKACAASISMKPDNLAFVQILKINFESDYLTGFWRLGTCKYMGMIVPESNQFFHHRHALFSRVCYMYTHTVFM